MQSTGSILLLGTASDSHIGRVRCALIEQLGRETVVLDYKMSTYSLEQKRSGHVHLAVDGVDVGQCPAIYDRVLLKRDTPFYPSGNQREAEFVAREYESLYRLIAALLPQKVVNPPASRLCAEKPFQQRAAAWAGLLVPRTIVSNSRPDLLNFARSCSGTMVIKPLSHGMLYRDEADDVNPHLVMTNRISLDQVAEYADANLTFCPTFLQEEIIKAYELRIVFVAGRCFSFKIDSQSFDYSSVDWRRMSTALEYIDTLIPEEIQSQIRVMMRHLDLVFGCLDFIVDLDGNYWFLECNNQGAWAWLDDQCGGDIALAIARELAC